MKGVTPKMGPRQVYSAKQNIQTERDLYERDKVLTIDLTMEFRPSVTEWRGRYQHRSFNLLDLV